MIRLVDDCFEGCAAVEDAAASRTKDIPGHLECAYAGCMEKRSDRFLFIEIVLVGKRERIDAIELAIRAMHDDLLDALDRPRVSCLSQGGKKDVHFAH